MYKNALSTPVLLLLFNRPDATRKVLDEIRKVRPRKLFVSMDGPRPDNADDRKKCEQVKICINNIDWECDCHTNIRQKNMGLKLAVRSGIDWFFDNVSEGIILEDDCVPSNSFFHYCEMLLTKYRDDTRVMMISGSNGQGGIKRGEASYYFSRIAGVHGWATWKRAWNLFDPDVRAFQAFRKSGKMKGYFTHQSTGNYWLEKIEDNMYGGKSWAFPWAFALFLRDGLCACPNMNLITNIGWGNDASNGGKEDSEFANMMSEEIVNIVHPACVFPDESADEYLTQKVVIEERVALHSLAGVKCRVKRMLGRIVGADRVNNWMGRINQ